MTPYCVFDSSQNLFSKPLYELLTYITADQSVVGSLINVH